MLMTKTVIPSKETITSQIVTITPAQASSWLDANKFHNRNLSDRNVDRIARDIKAGKWVFDGNPIRFDKENNILDGQHRLWAIVKSGKTVKSAVIRGLENEAKMVIDSGKSRSNTDFLHFQGYQNASVLAAVARLSIGYKDNGKDLWKWAQGTSAVRLTGQEIIAEVDANPNLEGAVKATMGLRFSRKILSPATVAFCYYLFASVEKNLTRVDKFFMDFETGNNLHEDSPILSLRNTFTVRDIDLMERHGGNKVMAYRVALVIKAWNAWKDNEVIKRFQYKVTKDKYPVPR